MMAAVTHVVHLRPFRRKAANLFEKSIRRAKSVAGSPHPHAIGDHTALRVESDSKLARAFVAQE